MTSDINLNNIKGGEPPLIGPKSFCVLSQTHIRTHRHDCDNISLVEFLHHRCLLSCCIYSIMQVIKQFEQISSSFSSIIVIIVVKFTLLSYQARNYNNIFLYSQMPSLASIHSSTALSRIFDVTSNVCNISEMLIFLISWFEKLVQVHRNNLFPYFILMMKKGC